MLGGRVGTVVVVVEVVVVGAVVEVVCVVVVVGWVVVVIEIGAVVVVTLHLGELQLIDFCFETQGAGVHMLVVESMQHFLPPPAMPPKISPKP